MLLTVPALPQRVKVIHKSGLKGLPKGEKFAFLEPATDTTNNLRFVATIEASGMNSYTVITDLYFAIREKATRLGANCFLIRSFSRAGSRASVMLVLDCFVATDSLLQVNTANHEMNVVFIFGDEKDDKKTTYKLEVGGVKNEIKSGAYVKYHLKEGADLTINAGGYFGETEWLHAVQNKQPVFFYLTKSMQKSDQPFFATEPAKPAFAPEHMYPVNNISLGLLLAKLLSPLN